MNDKWQAGHELLMSMMGPEFTAGIEGAAKANHFGSDIARMAIEWAFGDVWARSGLPRRDRSIVVISALIAMDKHAELKNHVRFGLNNGLTVAEIQEILIQTIPYVGFPKIGEATTAVIEVLRERGLDSGVKTSQEKKLL